MQPIAFGHRRKVGKDRASQFIVSHLRLQGDRSRIERASIFYEQKLLCHKLYGWCGLRHPDYYETESGMIDKEKILPKIGKSPRQIYIEFAIGTEAIHPTTGIDYLFHICEDVEKLVISDLRRPCEADRIHERGGYVIRIDKPDVPKATDVVDMAMSAYGDWDAVICNDGDLNKLHREVVRVATMLKI